MTPEITSKIVGYRIRDNSETSVSSTPPRPDVDPLTLRIERRPDGSLEAVSEKITYSDSEGRQRVYVLVSFMTVTGFVDGKEVQVERPIEFFIPSGQLSSEHQWITATMRSLSLTARGGYITQALQDLRKVAWDKGPVRCGKNQYKKPIYHDSVVAAMAWSIQQILHQRGFLDADGNQIPLSEMTAKASIKTETPLALVPEPQESGEAKGNNGVIGTCGTCSGDLMLMDGCPTCTTCGWSSCS